VTKLALLIAFFSIIASAASTDSTDLKVEAVPGAGKQKVDLPSSRPGDVDLIKTEKKIVDKNCRMVHGKMECIRQGKRIKRKVID